MPFRIKFSRSIFFTTAACLVWFKFFAFHLYLNQCGEEAIFLPDSASYVNLAGSLIKNKAFAQIDQNGVLVPEIFRTPGYPIFLAILSGVFQFDFIRIVYVQIFLSILTALIVYKIMGVVDPGLKRLCALFMLFDFSVTYNSMLMITETLFTCVLTGFLYFFVIYLNSEKTRDLLIAAFLSHVSSEFVACAELYAAWGMALFQHWRRFLRRRRDYRQLSKIECVRGIAVDLLPLEFFQPDSACLNPYNADDTPGCRFNSNV